VLTAALPPQAVPVYSGFDYVTIDPARRRVYAAHTGSRALLIVDADSGKVVGQVRVGPMHGVAVDPANGHVFTGDGDANTVSEVDPVAMKVLRTVDVAAAIDAIAYDPGNHRIYADEDDGTKVVVVDAVSFKVMKTIIVPGHKPEYLAVDPSTHDVYQNIDNLAEIAVISASSMSVTRTIPTTVLQHNHPLRYDAALNEIAVAGTNGVMAVYRPNGTMVGQLAVGHYDQCDLDPSQHILACAGDGGITRIQLVADVAPHVIDTTPVAPGVHTCAIDPVTHAVFAVWSNRDGTGDFVEKLIP
jgi:DNA-binding beta-propeller fold protein YncE